MRRGRSALDFDVVAAVDRHCGLAPVCGLRRLVNPFASVGRIARQENELRRPTEVANAYAFRRHEMGNHSFHLGSASRRQSDCLLGPPQIEGRHLLFRVLLAGLGTVEVETRDGRDFRAKSGGARRQHQLRAEEVARRWSASNASTMERLLAQVRTPSWWRRLLGWAQ